MNVLAKPCLMLSGAFSVLCVAVFAQTVLPPAPPPDEIDPPEFRVKSEVDVVLLDVAVKDSKGGFVSGLQKNSFQVLEDKSPQTISIFAAQDVPVTVGLVVDNSGSVRPKKSEIVTAALTFAGQSNPKDEIFVVNFNDKVRMGLPDDKPFTDDHTVLREALLINPAEGRTSLYDGLKTALQHLDKGHLDKKTLILISDGGDNASETTRDEIMRWAEQSLATIYTVGIYNPLDKDKDPGFLKDISRLTGGEHYEPASMGKLVDVCTKIAHDIRNRYTIGYTPSDRVFKNKVRRLRVIATTEDGRKLQARTRTHYLAPADAARSRSEH